MAKRIAKSHPEQNGRHERITLKQETALLPERKSLVAAKVYDGFPQEYYPCLSGPCIPRR